jgi:hydroxyacylglutathione hydrolase
MEAGMFVKKIVSEGLAHNSYFVGSGTAAAVIDPRRDVEVYLEEARARNMHITHIFETHKNEDYVIGSLEIAARNDVEILHGSRLDFAYGTPVHDGETFRIGTLELGVLETPGHTLESISVTLKETAISDDVLMVFTGDALFAGDAGRTDFYGKDRQKEMSTYLYESIHEKLLPLGDGVIVCPAHGSGSVCAAGIADLEYTSIGYEKATNFLLHMTREEFIDFKGTEEHYYPPYFRRMEEWNKNGAPLLHTLPHLKYMGPGEVEAMMKRGAQVVDIRAPPCFAGGHIPGSINIPREHISAYAGYLVNYDNPIILVDDFNQDLESVVEYFVRIGYDNIHGCLAPGFSAWYVAGKKLEYVDSWNHEILEKHLADPSLFILDVRTRDNWNKNGHIGDAHHIFLGHLPDRIDEVPHDRQVLVYCEVGFKGGIGASLLKQAGYERVANLLGGMRGWIAAGHPVNKT